MTDGQKERLLAQLEEIAARAGAGQWTAIVRGVGKTVFVYEALVTEQIAPERAVTGRGGRRVWEAE